MTTDNDNSSDASADKVEVIPTSEIELEKSPQGEPRTTDIYAEITTYLTQYTDRPDLLLNVIEQHDPGFIKSVNESAKKFSEEARDSRFRFGKIQAYSGLSVSIIAAAVVLIALVYLIYTGNISFLNFVGLAVFYAITQGGSGGFIRIIKACEKLISGAKRDS